MDIRLDHQYGNPWMLIGYSDIDHGLVMRRLTEDFSEFDEVVLSQTDFGLVCIDKKKNYVDVFDDMKGAYIWLSDYE